MSGAALQLAPPNLFASLRRARAFLDTQATLRTLNPQQAATVATIAETIIPRTQTTGAADIGATQFIDLILTEWSTEEESSAFLSGLADVDVRTQTSFAKRFVECSPEQRAKTLKDLGDVMLQEADIARRSKPGYRGSPAKPDKNFYYMMRNLTMTAYFTSEQGGKEPGFQVNPDR